MQHCARYALTFRRCVTFSLTICATSAYISSGSLNLPIITWCLLKKTIRCTVATCQTPEYQISSKVTQSNREPRCMILNMFVTWQRQPSWIMQSSKSSHTFQMCWLSPSSGSPDDGESKHFRMSARLYGAILSGGCHLYTRHRKNPNLTSDTA
jgi:hypothetical protein